MRSPDTCRSDRLAEKIKAYTLRREAIAVMVGEILLRSEKLMSKIGCQCILDR